MFIQTEETPNPNALKFLTNSKIIKENQNITYNQGGDFASSPRFIQDIFTINSVKTVTVFPDFLTVMIDDETKWPMVRAEIIHILIESGSNGMLKIDENTTQNDEKTQQIFEGIAKEIADLIDERVRPAVEMDGGDIEFIRFDEETGIVYVRMKGSCNGCPSSSATLKGGIKKMLEYYVPEVTDVMPIEE
jgi:Fe-S cluster biogenesis protein NfuA